MAKKRFYIILITLASLLIIGGLIWYLFFAPSQPAPVGGGADFTTPGKIAEGKLKAISDGPVISAIYNSAQNMVFFYDFSGQLWQLNQGELKPILLNEKPIENLAEIIWPKVFSPDGKKIVYQKNNSLLTSDPSGKNQRALITALKLRDAVLAWPKTNQISFTSKPSGLAQGNLWNLDTRSLIFTKTLNGFFGLETLWSPDGNNLIYSFTDQNGRNLKLAALDSKGASKDLGNISTLVDKCVWLADSINVICAVPASWLESLVLPDDYFKRTSLTTDDVWKINTQTEEKKLIAQGLGDVTNILIGENENPLFFILRNNQFLYQLNLE